MAYKKNDTVREDHFKRSVHRSTPNRLILENIRQYLNEESVEEVSQPLEAAAPKKTGRQTGSRNIGWEERLKLEPLFNDPKLDYKTISLIVGRAPNTLCKEYARGVVKTVGKDGENYYHYDPKVAQADAEEKKNNVKKNACKNKNRKAVTAPRKQKTTNKTKK